jgi:GNAT superfamily N-acetyltransferase
MPEPLESPEKLPAEHDVSAFDCGAVELTEWLQRYALQNLHAGNASTYVASRGGRVVGYYALATSGVEKAQAPDRVKKGGVPSHVPCLLLARLAVDRSEQGGGLGRGLFVDALRRSARVSEHVGVRALLVHARDEAAREFYLHHGEFSPSPTDPLHLFLLLSDARKLLRFQS